MDFGSIGSSSTGSANKGWQYVCVHSGYQWPNAPSGMSIRLRTLLRSWFCAIALKPLTACSFPASTSALMSTWYLRPTTNNYMCTEGEVHASGSGMTLLHRGFHGTTHHAFNRGFNTLAAH